MAGYRATSVPAASARTTAIAQVGHLGNQNIPIDFAALCEGLGRAPRVFAHCEEFAAA
ncbi:MAG: hypothetical protein U0R19_21810 [Bryobacteraceae bacterium]